MGGLAIAIEGRVCTTSRFNSLHTAPIKAACVLRVQMGSCRCAGAGALALVLTAAAPDRRPRCPLLTACAGLLPPLALAAFAGPAQCSRVGSTQHHPSRPLAAGAGPRHPCRAC